jgi:sec-independent protein translocase protein TatA
MPFIGNIGPGELLLLLIIILVIFGPGRLPEIGNALGKGIREFRKASSDVAEATRLEPSPPAASNAPPQPPDATPPAPSQGDAASAAGSAGPPAGSAGPPAGSDGAPAGSESHDQEPTA